MADDIALVELDHADALDALQDLAGDDEATTVAGDVDLCHVAGHDGLRPEAKSCEEHFHLLRRRVLGLVQDDEGLIQSSSPHVCQRRDLDLTSLLRPRETLRRHELVQRVVQGTKVRIDLLLQIARKESKALPRLDRWAREDETAHLSVPQSRDAHRDGQVALPGAGNAYREDQIVLANRLDVPALVLRLRCDALAPDRRRHNLAHLGRRRDRRFLRITDEALERRLAQRLIAPGQGPPHR